MKGPRSRRHVSLAAIVLGVIGIFLLFAGPKFDDVGSGAVRALCSAVGCVSLATAAIAVASRFDRRSAAWLRLDWFLPQLRRPRSDRLASDRWMGRTIRRIVPASWRSDHAKKRRGAMRRGLRRLGISWLASPPRRVVQAVCLVLFLISFFYVCWPYHARPVVDQVLVRGAEFVEIGSEDGEILLRVDPLPELPVGLGETVFLARPDEQGTSVQADARQVAPFRFASLQGDTISLDPVAELSDSFFDALLMTPSDWELHSHDPVAWPSHYADSLAAKERLPAELFLTIDPLVSLSTAIASRSWVASLVSAAVILIVCLLIPRGFCGYLCPLGTTIDLFDWAIGSRTKRFRVPAEGWWVHTKYYLLAGTLVAAVAGVLVSGFFAAIPVITRALLFIGEPIQSGASRGWHLVPAMNGGHVLSLFLFAVVLGLGFLRPRFWCKYVCPSGALFSVANLFRFSERKVESSCIHCNKCVEICPFDAIKPDFTTRGTDCTMCQSCGGVCPTHAIKFVERWNVVELKVEDEPPTGETSLGRRGFFSLAAGGAAATLGGIGAAKAVKLSAGEPLSGGQLPVRPPGSVPEDKFLQLCIRCGECFKACPNNVLQPEAFQQGWEGLWTPVVQADWAGCESSCNACGQVCPTGAIRPLPLEEKRVARMGLAIVNESTCLPFADQEDCDLCVQECNAAGYHAIEYAQVGTEVDDQGRPIEGSGRLAPVLLEDQCVGCGLCQTRCYAINVKEKGLLTHSAIVIEAGEGKEDRLMTGSYRELRQSERADLRAAPSEEAEFFVPELPTPPEGQLPNDGELPSDLSGDSDADDISVVDENPFGL